MANYGLFSLITARNVRESSAVSYRNFTVGCVVVGFDEQQNRIGLFTGVNVKVDSTDLVNIHAETIAIEKARRQGFSSLSLVSVVGETQEDHHSGLTTKTLHPCGKCRAMFDTSPLINEETGFLSATPDLRTLEVYDLQTVTAVHDQQPDATIAQFDLADEALDWDMQVIPYLVSHSNTNEATRLQSQPAPMEKDWI